MAINFGHISGAEPSTVTFKAATITQTINSSAMHKEVIVLGDPQSSIGIAVVKAAAPVSTEFGLVVRIAGGPSSAVDCAIRAILPSTAADNPVLISGNSTAVISAFAAGLISSAVQAGGSSALTVRNVWSSTHADQPVQATQGTNPWTIAGNSTIVFLPAYLSTGVAPPSNSTALNVRIVGGVSSAADFPVSVLGYSTIVSVANTVAITQAAYSTIVSVANAVALSAAQSSVMPSSGSSGLVVRQVWDLRASAASTNAMAASTAFSVASSAVGKVYVTAYSITSTVQAPTVLRFMSGSTLVWPVVLAALSSAVSGVNLAGYPFLFCSPAAARPMTLNIASTLAGFKVGVTYFRAP